MKKIKKVLAIFIPIFMVMAVCFGVAMPVSVKKGDNVSELSSSNYSYAEDTGAHTAAKSKKGGSIYLAPNTKYTMKNGTIKNKLKQYGGAVYVCDGATFTMTGGTITGCQAQYGGAIYVENGGTCIIDGGTIKGNKAEVAPAIYAETGANVQIISGDVDDNSIAEFKEAFKLGPIPEGVTVVRNGENIQSGTIVYTNDILTITFPETEIKDDVYVESSVKGAERESGTNDYKVTDNVRIIHQELAATLDKIKFNLVDGDHYEVSKTSNDITGEVIIPSYHEGQPVTAIAAGTYSTTGTGFYDCDKITSVKMPDSMTSIGEEAFYHCSKLAKADIPERVTEIGRLAFSYCPCITSITIPENVTKIGDGAFAYCNNVTEINYNATNCADLSSDSYVFSSIGPDEGGTFLTIGDNVERIPNALFGVYTIERSNITNVKIGNKVTSIGEYAFSNCDKITNVTIPKKVASIGRFAFQNTGITSITIPENVTSLGEYSFQNCKSLIEIRFNATNCVDISGSPFRNSGKAGVDFSVIIGDNVERIPKNLLDENSNITSLTIGSRVNSIDNRITNGCTRLSEIKIKVDNSNYASQNNAGKECNAIIDKNTNTLIAGCKASEIPNDGSVTTIGDYAFYGQSSLQNITIPNSVTNIGKCAFYECRGLTSITIPENVIVIGRD